MIEEIGKGIRVDVEKFYDLVKKAIEIYINKILDNREIELKKNFINKMNYIAYKGTKVKLKNYISNLFNTTIFNNEFVVFMLFYEKQSKSVIKLIY